MTAKYAATLNKEEITYLITLMGLNPKIKSKEIESQFLDRFGKILTDKHLDSVKSKYQSKIAEIRTNDSLALKLAEVFGFITLTSKVRRIQLLEDLINKCSQGYETEIVAPKGNILTIVKKDFAIAINALKLIKEEIEGLKVDNQTYVIQIGEAKPPKLEDELPGDDELQKSFQNRFA